MKVSMDRDKGIFEKYIFLTVEQNSSLRNQNLEATRESCLPVRNLDICHHVPKNQPLVSFLNQKTLIHTFISYFFSIYIVIVPLYLRHGLPNDLSALGLSSKVFEIGLIVVYRK
jgi:hypothetical protein